MEIPRHWRLKKQRYNLQGIICQNCETKVFPPRPVCPECKDKTYIHPTQTISIEVYNANGVTSLPVDSSMSSK